MVTSFPISIAIATGLLLVPSTFSPGILLLMLAMLAVSVHAFVVLCRQWTTHRPMQALRDWASDRKFKLSFSPDAALPEALEGLKPLDAQIENLLAGESMILIRLTTVAQGIAGEIALVRPHWHLLIGRSRGRHPAGLRPVHAARSFLDLFSLNGFPSLLPPERFLAMGSSAKDARVLSDSPALGLLPADIGLLVHGPYITLDFSSRPFDSIEFERMLTILQQVIQHDP